MFRAQSWRENRIDWSLSQLNIRLFCCDQDSSFSTSFWITNTHSWSVEILQCRYKVVSLAYWMVLVYVRSASSATYKLNSTEPSILFWGIKETLISFKTLALSVGGFLIACATASSVKTFIILSWNLNGVPVSFFRFNFLIMFAKYLLNLFAISLPSFIVLSFSFNIILLHVLDLSVKKGFTAVQNLLLSVRRS